MRRGFHFVPGFIEKLVVFRSSFFGARFRSAGAAEHRIKGNAFQHPADKFRLFARSGAGGMDNRRPVAQGVEGAFKADSFQTDIMQMRGLLHKGTHQIIGD